MLKLPKGLKKKKKGKKSKRKGEDELFTEEELEKYRKEHQQQQLEAGEGSVKENEEWSKFKDLTTGIDSVLKKTQGDLDRIKSTSFFQRVPAGVKELKRVEKEKPQRAVIEVTEADFPQLVQAAAEAEEAEKSEYGVTDDESEEDEDQDDIFDTSYVDAVERGEVKLAYVPDSPEECQDDDIFDTSHVDAIIKGQEAKTTKGKKALDIGVAVEVLTGRIDNFTVTTRKTKRTIPGDLLLEDTDKDSSFKPGVAVVETVEKSILDIDADIPISTPIDLSVSLHTSLLQQQNKTCEESVETHTEEQVEEEQEIDEFTLLAAESLETSAEKKLEGREIKAEPVIQESWSVFEADKNETVFADGVVEDQIDIIDPYLDQDDPFDTSFADAVVPINELRNLPKQTSILEDDDDFDPRAEEFSAILNNRRKSSVRIHLTNPSGLRESITSDESVVKEDISTARDLLGGSTTDLTRLGDSPLNPVEINEDEIDPFDTSIVDKIVAPGKIELKLLEQELIDSQPQKIYRVESDPDFDPRSDEQQKVERRASRPENLIVNKSVGFSVEGQSDSDSKQKFTKPLTPYYSRDLSITEDLNEESEVGDTLTRTRSDENLNQKLNYQAKRRHSEYPQPSSGKKASDLLQCVDSEIQVKVLTPSGPPEPEIPEETEIDPFDTSFASNIAPCKTELKLLTKEFSCEEPKAQGENFDLLNPSDDIFQVKALTPEATDTSRLPIDDDFDPFDTSFASNLNPGRTELKLLESEFLN